MAKKKIVSEDASAIPAAPPATTPAKRRAPAKGAVKKASNGKTQPTEAEIAEAAYFRHLSRGGGHGDQFDDWIEAERELKARRR